MKPSLDEFAAAENVHAGVTPYLDTLPAGVRADLLQSKAPHAAASRWLHKLGHKKASTEMVRTWRLKNGWTKA